MSVISTLTTTVIHTVPVGLYPSDVGIARIVTGTPDPSHWSRDPAAGASKQHRGGVASASNSTKHYVGGTVTSKNHTGDLAKNTSAQHGRHHYLAHSAVARGPKGTRPHA